jgi:hypothetical protein
MLPDLRIVIAAVVSTFIFTVGVGFFASSRLIHEQMTARVDTKGFDDTPINRIALNWPEPVKTDRNVDLDFAVSAKASRNPVRDIAPDVEQQQMQAQKIAAPSATVSTPAPAPEIAPVAAIAPAPATAPIPEVLAQPEPAPREPEPTITIAKAPDPVEAAPPAPPAPSVMPTLPATPSVSSVSESPTETHVGVRPQDVAPLESTGSIPTPAPASPDIPLPESRPKFAARPEPAGTIETAKPAASAPARKRPRPAAIAQRPVLRSPAPQTQLQQQQPFDFFGLFRTSPATLRLPPQVSAPTTPIN